MINVIGFMNSIIVVAFVSLSILSYLWAVDNDVLSNIKLSSEIVAGINLPYFLY